MKKIILIALLILAGAGFALPLIHFLKLSSVKFIGSEFLLGYLGVFLGFAFSVVTFVLSIIDKVCETVEKDETYSTEEKKETRDRTNKFTQEVFDTMLFLFVSFLTVVLVMIFEVYDFPNLSVNLETWYSKMNVLNAIKFSIFGFSVYGIYDLLIGTLRVNNKASVIRGRAAQS